MIIQLYNLSEIMNNSSKTMSSSVVPLQKRLIIFVILNIIHINALLKVIHVLKFEIFQQHILIG